MSLNSNEPGLKVLVLPLSMYSTRYWYTTDRTFAEMIMSYADSSLGVDRSLNKISNKLSRHRNWAKRLRAIIKYKKLMFLPEVKTFKPSSAISQYLAFFKAHISSWRNEFQLEGNCCSSSVIESEVDLLAVDRRAESSCLVSTSSSILKETSLPSLIP